MYVLCIRVGVEVNYSVFRGSGTHGNSLAVRGVSPQAVAQLALSIKTTVRRNLGNLSARQRWLPVTKTEYEAYKLEFGEFGQFYVRTKVAGVGILAYQILVLDIFDGNHRWHAASQLIGDGSLTAKDVYFQTAVYDELLPDVVAVLTGRLLNEYVRFLV